MAAVAFLAVAQQQLRGGAVGADEADLEGGATAGDEGCDGWMGGIGGGGSDDDHFFGLVGLSLTYALPIVGGCGLPSLALLGLRAFIVP